MAAARTGSKTGRSRAENNADNIEKTNTKEATKSSSKQTAYEKERQEVAKKVNEFKLIAEANAVSTMYKNPDLIKETNLELDDISNNMWKVFFAIANDIINVERKGTLDELTINMYLSKHDKLREKYDEYGGFEKISATFDYVKEENFESYVSEIKKWNAVLKISDLGFPVKDRLSQYVDWTAEDIYNELEALLNHVFVNVDSEIKTYNACEGLYDLIDRLDSGSQVGMPMSDCEILNREIGGINLNGNIYGLGASSGVGKSSMAINYLMPSVIKYNEKMVMMINEEDQDKVKRELLVWVANNVFKQELHKYILRDGKFNQETKDLLYKCAEWLEEKKNNKNITIIPFEKYTAKAAVKVIKKYASMGVKLFVLDTLKESTDSRNIDTWKSMERDMVDLYDTVKPKGKNVGLFVTYQLGKASIKLRYLTNNEIGQAKNILDVISVNLLMRRPFEDEYEGGKNEIKAYKLAGVNGKSKIPYKLSRDKHYMITFISKNRFGQTDAFQIVSECDLSTNVHRDVAICNIPQDW